MLTRSELRWGAWRLARESLPRPVKRVLKGMLPAAWKPEGSFQRACLDAMGVKPGQTLTPLQQTYVDFALSTTERGLWAAEIVNRVKPLDGTRCLDVGCAYGGFVVALCKLGAREVVGIDVDDGLLALGRANVEEHGVPATLLQLDVHDPAAIAELGSFDVIVCNDVLEHVRELPLAIAHLCRLCATGGLVYSVVPNKYFPRYLARDSHYRLPGITLLSHDDAAVYYQRALGWSRPYDVGHYRTLTYYAHHFHRCGMAVDVYRQGMGIFDVAQLREEFAQARTAIDGLDAAALPPAIVRKIRTRFEAVHRTFLALADAHARARATGDPDADRLEERIITRFGMEGLYVLARKPPPGAAVPSPMPSIRPRVRGRSVPTAASPTPAAEGTQPDPDFVDQVIAEYLADYAADEHARLAAGFDRVRFRRSLEWLADVGLAGKRVLELGGYGIASHLLRRRFPDAEHVTDAFDLRGTFPHPDASFDLVVAMEVIEHVGDVHYTHGTSFSGVRSCLSEIARVLRPGGHLFLTTPNAASIWIVQRALLQQPPWFFEGHFREYTPTELRGFLEHAGLEVVALRTETVWHFWNFDPIIQFMRDNAYALDDRGDDVFVLARKRVPRAA